MIINTHLLFSKIIFKNCLNKPNIKLDKKSFMYGNVKPDLFSEDPNDAHSLEENAGTVKRYFNKLVNNKLTEQEFSLTLGMLCHYICDFFCIYHRREYKNKSMWTHIIYEIQLHFKLIMLLITGKLKLIQNVKLRKKDSLSMILEMRKKYQQEKESIIKDITFAVSTAILISESVLYLKKIKAKNNRIKKIKIYKMPRVAGAI